jgi:hypothetical protein
MLIIWLVKYMFDSKTASVYVTYMILINQGILTDREGTVRLTLF